LLQGVERQRQSGREGERERKAGRLDIIHVLIDVLVDIGVMTVEHLPCSADFASA
jgi:hypothetical protein